MRPRRPTANLLVDVATGSLGLLYSRSVEELAQLWELDNDALVGDAKPSLSNVVGVEMSEGWIDFQGRKVAHQSTAVSSNNRPVAKRSTLSWVASIRSERPCRIKSAVMRPEAGECITP